MRTRAPLLLAIAAGLLYAGPALAFLRTQTPTGTPLFWKDPHVTMLVYQKGATPSCGNDAATSMAAVQSVIPTWGLATRAGESQRCTGARISLGGPTTSDETGFFLGEPGAPANSNLIVWRTQFCSQVVPAGDACYQACPAGVYCQNCPSKYHCWDDTRAAKIIALTTVTYDTVKGQIYDADMELDGWNGTAGALSSPSNPLGNLDGWYFTCVDRPGGPGLPPPVCAAGDPSPSSVCTCTNYAQPNCIFMDVQNTVTHELGHVLGLAHPPDHPEDTMAATAAPGETSKRVLAADDVEGICSVYPAPKPSGGCATAGGQPALLALLLGALALRLSRRRHAAVRSVSSTRRAGTR
ncbi:MAG TPA: matrixin family metalloprotease [Anaeromyxobacteraceae bacterium]|jgi:hypothetical protein|nr:matrixin family metalloprotease [Anaeromyxobacteraceae bacterium]